MFGTKSRLFGKVESPLASCGTSSFLMSGSCLWHLGRGWSTYRHLSARPPWYPGCLAYQSPLLPKLLASIVEQFFLFPLLSPSQPNWNLFLIWGRGREIGERKTYSQLCSGPNPFSFISVPNPLRLSRGLGFGRRKLRRDGGYLCFLPATSLPWGDEHNWLHKRLETECGLISTKAFCSSNNSSICWAPTLLDILLFIFQGNSVK